MSVSVLCWLLGMNALAACQFRSDKLCAIAGRRRIPEARLLWLAVFGGSPAMLVARKLLRHKTRKQPFSKYLLLIATIQAGSALSLLIW